MQELCFAHGRGVNFARTGYSRQEEGSIIESLITPLLPVVVHTAVIYLALICYIRFFGRRQLSQPTYVQLVVIMILGSSVETEMVAGNTTFLAGFTSAATLLLGNWLFTTGVERWWWFRLFMIGVPVILARDGTFLLDNMRTTGLTEADVLALIREHGYAVPAELAYIIREADGSIGVIPRSSESLRRVRTVRMRPS